MRIATKTILLGLALALNPSLGFAQSAQDIQLAKAQLWAAQDAFESGDYLETLSKVEAAETTMGSAGAQTLQLKTRALHKLERFEEAKSALDEFYTYNPSSDNERTMAPILLDLESRMENIRAAKIKAAADRVDAEKVAAKARFEAVKAQAEAARIAPLIAAEKRLKDEILSTSGATEFKGRVSLVQEAGHTGISYRNSTSEPGYQPRDGGDASEGKGAGSYLIFMETIGFDYISDLVLVTIKNIANDLATSAYWDTESALYINARGASGGDGGRGERGANGKNGKDSTFFTDPEDGGHGVYGGDGGDGGNGGAGGNIKVFVLNQTETIVSTNDFIVDVSGGAGGNAGQGGVGGGGGKGGLYRGYRAASGRNGVPGKNGKAGRVGMQGLFTTEQTSLEQFKQYNILLHRESGPIVSQNSLEAMKGATAIDTSSQNTLSVQTGADLQGDRDAQPIVRIPPIFPPDFLQGDHSGFCRLRFDVSASGTTMNVTAKECTNAMLQTSSVTSVHKWRYSPKIKNSQPVIRTGVESTILFNLQDERGLTLPFPQGFTPPVID